MLSMFQLLGRLARAMEKLTQIGRPTLVLAAVVAVAVGVLTFLISTPEASRPEPTPTAPPEPEPAVVSFGVWGTEAEIAAYQRVVDAYNADTVLTEAELESWPTADAMLAEIETGAADPDVFLLPREELGRTVAARHNRPVLELLDARGVSLGDHYSRTALAAFTSRDAQQCMPYTSSPMVIYYNTGLIDFEQLDEQGLPVPREEDGRWSLEAFEAAAEAATRPRGGTRGFAIEPTLEALAPFILSGGGRIFDDDVSPTSLALSNGDSVDALEEVLAVLRQSPYTLTEEQLERRTPLEWFKRGQLGMLAGYRDLVPELRAVDGLSFDVLPMPRIGSSVTVGEMTGLCLADGEQADVERAADFLVHVISAESVADVVASTGSLAPVHLEVAFSEDYLQPDRQPARSSVFTLNQRYIALWPLIEDWDALEALAADEMEALLTKPVLTPEEIETILAELDEESRALLDPEYDPSETESPDETDGDTETGESS